MSRLAAIVLLFGLFGDGKVAPVNVDKAGVALHGYDAVSYFERSAPVKGDAKLAYAWHGATWWFATAEDRKKFVEKPESFAPQYGGYCAKAVSENNTADIDPLAYMIVDDKLYLNYSPKIQKVWQQDIPGRIAKADANWPGLQRKP
jgi:YHS domain-containing protein